MLVLFGLEAGSTYWIHEPDRFFFWLALVTLTGIGLFGYGFLVRRRKHMIESIPTSPIRSLAVGLVEVSGTAEPMDLPLQSPFSQTPCVFYSYKVEEWRNSGGQMDWVTIKQGVSHEPFLVRDQTGKILIDPTEAKLIVEDDQTYDNRSLKVFPPEVKTGLQGLGVATEGWWLEKLLRCTEAFIRPKDTVYVLGTAQQNLKTTDALANEDRLFIGSHPDEMFIISDRSEKDLLADLGSQVWFMLWGGPLLTLVCLLVILSRYLRIGF